MSIRLEALVWPDAAAPVERGGLAAVAATGLAAAFLATSADLFAVLPVAAFFVVEAFFFDVPAIVFTPSYVPGCRKRASLRTVG
ncbi:MAG TPA: hypothetical protein PKJ99_08170 [Thermoanaerobaculales bacterium]|nr:hypothetical protein [Thermoanaerobaculales bacterium]